MRRLLTDPDQFFAARRRDPRPLGAAAAVLVVGLVASAPVAQLLPALPVPVPGMPPVLLAAVVGVGAVLATWIGNAAVVHVASAPVATTGEFETTLALTGWSLLPTGGSFAAFAAIAVETTNVGYWLATASVAELVALPTVRVAVGLVAVFTLWHACLTFFAVEHGRGVTGVRAAAVTAAPFVVVALAVLAAT